MIQKPYFSDSELLCILEATKVDLKIFNATDTSFMRDEDASEIKHEFEEIISKIQKWHKQSCDCSKVVNSLIYCT